MIGQQVVQMWQVETFNMNDKNFWVKRIDNNIDLLHVNIFCSIDNIYKVYKIEIPSGKRPFISHTATMGMVEAIGNIKNSNIATAYYLGNPKYEFKVNNIYGYKKGERVIVSEHIRLDGKIEYLVSKNRLLQGNLNFVNIGHYNEKNDGIIKMIVDVITGEHKVL